MHSFRHTATSISYTCTTYTHCVHVMCTYTVEAHDKPDTRNACLLARAQPGMPAGVPAVHVRRGDRSARSLGRSLAERRGGARQGGVGEGGITASQARWHADDNQVLHGPSKWCVRLRKRDGMICTRHACKGCARHGVVRRAPQARRHQMKCRASQARRHAVHVSGLKSWRCAVRVAVTVADQPSLRSPQRLSAAAWRRLGGMACRWHQHSTSDDSESASSAGLIAAL